MMNVLRQKRNNPVLNTSGPNFFKLTFSSYRNRLI